MDIDLTYLPVEPREASLQAISAALSRITKSIRRAIPTARVQESYLGNPQRTSKLFVRERAIQIKIEPNEVLRGSVYPPQERSLSNKAEESFGHQVSIKTLSPADLYGGKLCALWIASTLGISSTSKSFWRRRGSQKKSARLLWSIWPAPTGRCMNFRSLFAEISKKSLKRNS